MLIRSNLEGASKAFENPLHNPMKKAVGDDTPHQAGGFSYSRPNDPSSESDEGSSGFTYHGGSLNSDQGGDHE